MIVGLTGNMGSGKSTVGRLLAHDPVFQVISTDEVAHKVLDSDDYCREFVRDHFGEEYLLPQGIDRKKLGKLVFNEPKELYKLETFMLPWVFAELQNMYLVDKINVVESAILFEKFLHPTCNRIVIVTSNHMQNNWEQTAYSPEEIASRLKLQSHIPLENKITWSDYVLQNDYSLDILEMQVKHLAKWLKACWKWRN